jgi:hypothetical protein
MKVQATNRAVAAVVTAVFTSWAPWAAALDRDGAIEVAKRQVKGKCDSTTLCTFTVTTAEGKWHVRVDFIKPNSHAIFIIDQSGRVVGRLEGK